MMATMAPTVDTAITARAGGDVVAGKSRRSGNSVHRLLDLSSVRGRDGVGSGHPISTWWFETLLIVIISGDYEDMYILVPVPTPVRPLKLEIPGSSHAAINIQRCRELPAYSRAFIAIHLRKTGDPGSQCSNFAS